MLHPKEDHLVGETMTLHGIKRIKLELLAYKYLNHLFLKGTLATGATVLIIEGIIIATV